MKTFVRAALFLSAAALGLAATPPAALKVSSLHPISLRSPAASEVVWVEDGVPAGATPQTNGGDAWNWVQSNPSPFSGSLSNQSAIAAGLHEHYFTGATATLSVSAGDLLSAYVYLDPANLPSEIMLQWNDGSGWEHRAYWGADSITYGTDATPGRQYMGPMPAAGQWVRLQVPASSVGLAGSTLTGMAFSQFNGRATWDRAGKTTVNAQSGAWTQTPLPPPTISSEENWIDDALPAGATGLADGGDSWNWIAGNPAPISGSLSHQSAVAPGLHEHFFNYASPALPVNTGDVLYAYVYLDPANVPGEIMLSWNADNWEHRAYWGANSIAYGTDGAASRLYMGPLPVAGTWVRLQVPASVVGLEGQSLSGMGFSVYGGHAEWDKAGNSSPVPGSPPIDPPAEPTVTVSGSSTGSTTTGTSSTSTGSSSTSTGTSTTSTGSSSTTTGTSTTSTGSGSTTTSSGTAGDQSNIDDLGLQLPKVGDSLLHVLSPNLLELITINSKQPDPAQVTDWNWIDSTGVFTAPALSEFVVTVNGAPMTVQAVGFKRRPLYAPLQGYDLRIENCLYLQLSQSVSDGQQVQVTNPDGTLWPASKQFTALVTPLRYNPAIHVNQEGYGSSLPKKAMVGYYLGSLGEMPVSTSLGFSIVNASTGASVYSGTLTSRQDVGYEYTPAPYQQVAQADFSSLTTPGEYQLVVPGLGASLPFLVNDGIPMGFLRTYELGIYHQRSGTSNAMPFTRFVHAPDHTAPAEVPVPQANYPFTWSCIPTKNSDTLATDPADVGPQLASQAAQLYPYVNTGTVDVSGGHHDAGDYSKYTINSASLVHYLMFAVDNIPGVAQLDNLGIPESGDGISDLMQEAKWEADYLAKLQDADGGFYFLVYPKNEEYEGNVLPENGETQVVWPKNTSATAASVAALAQCASSPLFKKTYPAVAALYLQKAQLGWQFLMNAVAKYGKDGSYQKVTFYGDDWIHNDEIAWAACEMYLATGDSQYQQQLFSWFPNPADPATFRWGWWRCAESWGCAIRDYAFAVRNGRMQAGQLDPNYLAACQGQIVAAGDDAATWSQQNAYASSFPPETKAVLGAGWYFSLDQGSDMAAAYQLNPKPAYIDALVGNMNYEGGCNPVNVCFLTGLGMKRQREIVDQYAQNDRRVLPPSGIPLGNIQASFDYLNNYQGELKELTFPSDDATTAPYPFYDRWTDGYNVSTEFITVNQARSILALSVLAAQSTAASQPWTSVAGQIAVPSATVPVGAPVTLSLTAPGVDLATARIVWEAKDQQPALGPTFTISPVNNGGQWVEAEAELPDGRRVFAAGTFTADSAVVNYVDGALPAGNKPGTQSVVGSDGGDSWNWVSANPTPFSAPLIHQSNSAAGVHEHWFINKPQDPNSNEGLLISTGDTLFAYVYLDPANPPTEVMLGWYDGSGWEHRAYWGANSITYGTDGGASRYAAGPLPTAGQWVKLAVPASAVGLEGINVTGVCFSLFGGDASWDVAGKSGPTAVVQPVDPSD